VSMSRFVSGLIVALGVSLPLPAQSGSGGEASISAEDLMRHVRTLADDSMAGRATPSAGLDAAAAYVADRFAAIGLEPAGDDGSFFQRYPIVTRVLSAERATIRFGGLPPLRFLTDWRRSGGGGAFRGGVAEREAVVLWGTPSNEQSLEGLELTGRLLLLIAPTDRAGQLEDPGLLVLLARLKPAAILYPSRVGRRQWAAATSGADALVPMPAPGWVHSLDSLEPVYAPDGAHRLGVSFLQVRAEALAPVLEEIGLRFDDLVAEADGPLQARRLAEPARIELAQDSSPAGDAPNVLGRLESASSAGTCAGTLVVTAHLDGVGVGEGGPEEADRIYNGADDNASGVAVLLELARVLSREALPCPVLFAAVSGEERGLWGSDFLARSLGSSAPRAAFNIDMVGRPWIRGVPGSVALTAGADERLISIVAAVKADQETLGIHVASLEEDPLMAESGLDERSDHASFRRRGIPALFLVSSRGFPEYHQPSDETEGVHSDHLALVATAAVHLVRLLSG
jgi:Peptidase family M28